MYSGNGSSVHDSNALTIMYSLMHQVQLCDHSPAMCYTTKPQNFLCVEQKEAGYYCKSERRLPRSTT